MSQERKETRKEKGRVNEEDGEESRVYVKDNDNQSNPGHVGFNSRTLSPLSRSRLPFVNFDSSPHTFFLITGTTYTFYISSSLSSSQSQGQG